MRSVRSKVTEKWRPIWTRSWWVMTSSTGGSSFRVGFTRSVATPAPDLTATRSEPGFGARRLEQLDGVARRVLDEDLPPAPALHDLVAEPRPRGAQHPHHLIEVLDFEREAV